MRTFTLLIFILLGLTAVAHDDLTAQHLTPFERQLLDARATAYPSCQCTSSTLDCGPYHVCVAGGCTITSKGCKTSGKEPCIGMCKYVEGPPK